LARLPAANHSKWAEFAAKNDAEAVFKRLELQDLFAANQISSFCRSCWMTTAGLT
jgi:hypothetical protein